jgi:hypothetical protein
MNAQRGPSCHLPAGLAIIGLPSPAIKQTSDSREASAPLARMSVARSFDRSLWRRRMKNPLDSLWGTVISGLVLTVILYEIVKNFLN